MVNIAIAKGRLEKDIFEFLNKAGYRIQNNKDSRKLFIEDEERKIKCFLVKPMDVPIYVSNNIADVGICGTDSIVESEVNILQPLKLPFGKSRMVLAGFKNWQLKRQPIVVATKFPITAKRYFESHGLEAKIIKLNGSVELAPIVGLADVIVDIVETGTTLKENGLVILDEIYKISAMLVLNEIAYRTKRIEITEFLDSLRGITK
ncbi:MAG: phosphoribosyltransferase [Thermotogaceae bacterium]|jgi:ATP phosphoribosyltransferase|nr:phosphoribosyltransferase [Thermotogaceae bacterium]MDN5336938.1 phosphoribosyltransferase [Thermotogaceae bacterium]